MLRRWIRPSIAGPPSGFVIADAVLDGCWLAPYADPWTPTATAGTSATHGTLVTSSGVPASGTAVNGFAPVTLNGAASLVTDTAAMSDIATIGAGTLIVLAKMSATTAPSSDFYTDASLLSDSTGFAGLTFTSSGVRGGVYDGASFQTAYIAQATGAWFMAACRWDGTGVKCRVNSTDATPVGGTSGPSGLGAGLYVGKSYTSIYVTGDMLFIGTAKTALSDADLTNIKSALNTLFALALP